MDRGSWQRPWLAWRPDDGGGDGGGDGDDDGEQTQTGQQPPAPPQGQSQEPPRAKDLPGPQGLRVHADRIERELAREKEEGERMRAELLTYRRREAFDAAVAAAEVEGMTLEEIGELPPEQITPALVRAKAAEKAQAQAARDEQMATELGFTSAEEMRAALEEARARRDQTRTDMATTAAIARGGPGAPPPARKSATEEAWENYGAERKQGRAHDAARAKFAETLLERAVADSAPRAGART